MHFLSSLVTRLLLALGCLPFAWAFLYLANFQRTIVVVGKKLAPSDEVLLPGDLRRAITPRWLSRANIAVLVFLGIIIVSAANSVGLAPALALFLFLLLTGFEGMSWFAVFLWVPKAGVAHFVSRIRDELESKRQRFVATSDVSHADEMDRLKRKLDSLRDATGAIPDWREVDAL